jgi:inward rectifier potassium channel
VAFGHDVVAARKVRAQKPYDHGDIRSEILDTAEDDRLRVDYGRFHETVRD